MFEDIILHSFTIELFSVCLSVVQRVGEIVARGRDWRRSTGGGLVAGDVSGGIVRTVADVRGNKRGSGDFRNGRGRQDRRSEGGGRVV